MVWQQDRMTGQAEADIESPMRLNPTSTRNIYRIPSGRRVAGSLTPPPSKSVTQRYFNLALLGGRQAEVARPLYSEDTRFFLGALADLGWKVEEQPDSVRLTPERTVAKAELWCGHGGTMLRFLTAALSTIPGEWILDGTPRLRQRPMAPLVDTLRRLGAEIDSLEEEGFAPLRIRGATLVGGETWLDAGQSSQFLSAVAMAAAHAERETIIRVETLTSAPYLDLTFDLLRASGVPAEWRDEKILVVQPHRIAAGEWQVERDYSAACYPAAAAALTGGRVEICGVDPQSKQGDRLFLAVLCDMGASVEWREGACVVSGPERLVGVDVDLSRMPDQVPTLAALAPFAEGSTRIRNVAHLRLKESDRLAAMATELRRLGGRVEELVNGLRIEGVWSSKSPPTEDVIVETHGDHRIAMALALTGLRRPGVHFAQPGVVAKSYPGFWRDLEGLLRQ